MPGFYIVKGQKIPEAEFEARPRKEPDKSWGPPLWDAALLAAMELESSRARLALVEAITIAVAGRCGCIAHWRRWVKENPPRVESKEAFFEWWVNARNDVRTRQGKETFTVEQARALYF